MWEKAAMYNRALTDLPSCTNMILDGFSSFHSIGTGKAVHGLLFFINGVIIKNKLTGYSSLHGAVYNLLFISIDFIFTLSANKKTWPLWLSYKEK